MPRTRLLTDEQLTELLATKTKQERIKLGIQFNLGLQTMTNLYNNYRHRRVEDVKKYEPLQMIMMPNLKSNEIKVNGTVMEFPENRAVIQGIEFSW